MYCLKDSKCKLKEKQKQQVGVKVERLIEHGRYEEAAALIFATSYVEVNSKEIIKNLAESLRESFEPLAKIKA